jgi:hypothetical protein
MADGRRGRCKIDGTVPTDVAYLAQGQLRLKPGAAPVRTIESQFGQSIRQRAVEINRRHAWKEQGRGGQFMRAGVLWGRGDDEADALRLTITGLSPGCRPGELLYALETPEISGVFVLKEGGRVEQRLLHTSDYRVGQLHAHPGGRRIAFVVREHRGTTSNIAVMDADGSGLREVTQGDSIDLSPRWAPGSDRLLVFQSAGIGRDAAGHYSGRGPFAIHQLDVDSGELTTLAEDQHVDLLGPQVAAGGALYYVRRPWEGAAKRIGFGRALLDLLLLPFRLAYAVFHYLNFFSMRYTGDPLTAGGDVRQKQADVRQMLIWGNLVNAREALRRAGSSEEAPALVPPAWELVRASGQAVAVLARGVLSFDLAPDGGLVYSNGSAILRLDPSGASARLVKDALIEHVVAVPAGPDTA